MDSPPEPQRGQATLGCPAALCGDAGIAWLPGDTGFNRVLELRASDVANQALGDDSGRFFVILALNDLKKILRD